MPAKVISPAIQSAMKKLDPTAQKAFRKDFDRSKKSTATAYLAWFLLGWHYLYMGKVGTQIAFWITAGGFFVWWIVDALRVPGMVARHNEDLARGLMAEYRAMA